MNTIYKTNTKRTDSLKDNLKRVVLKECLCNYQFIVVHGAEIHFGGCLLPSSGSRGLKLEKRSSRWPFPGHAGEKDGRDGERDVCSRNGVIISHSNLAFYTDFLILFVCLQNKGTETAAP
ncbi:unnamed protein product [Rangifer tarandus platyrhynchus]|uniref:Uncharacterized protein n=1 Tax=Rangifer tarandus platyrhynchus TaxID=3082113 RepID=A0ABN8YS94_RANTA|nr:unnamed protein product [Rangifer tarandus platyrhynchus]